MCLSPSSPLPPPTAIWLDVGGSETLENSLTKQLGDCRGPTCMDVHGQKDAEPAEPGGPAGQCWVPPPCTSPARQGGSWSNVIVPCDMQTG